MSLQKYRTKRKFESTNEPIGKVKEKKKKSLIFVVQKHNASHLHYDFRLESEGVLKSWAVPKGMPYPGEKKLAMMVEDHPYDYREFEGIIPPGNYGAGTVMVWDNGTYTLKGDENLSEQIKKGDVKFLLVGEKVAGEFALVRFKKGPENSWLFICKSRKDNADFDHEISVKSGKTLDQISSGEVDFKKIKGAKKQKMPDKISPMLAQLFEKPFDDPDWLFEIKWDGYRAIAKKQDNDAQLISRNQKSFTELFSIVTQELKKISGNFLLDGEIVVADEKGNLSFQMVQNYLNSKGGIPIYYVFDVLFFNGYNLLNVELMQRKEILKKFLPPSPHIKISEAIAKEGKKLFELIQQKNGEGIIAKRKDSFYREKIRTNDWLKIKIIKTQDVIICGFTEPRGGRKYFGALILGIYDNGELIYAGHVGGGFDEKTLEMVKRKLTPLIIEKCPFIDVPKTNMPAVWVKPQIVCEVKFSEWTQEGILRQPIFLGLRIDKEAAEVTKEIPGIDSISRKKIYHLESKNIKQLIEGKKLILSNLEKIYWPDEGYTKGDLINYYKSVSKFILPYLKDRPQSLNRFPNGINGESFFHKDMNDLPDWIKTIKVKSSDERVTNYMLCQDKASLIYLANLGCIEINVWNSSVGNLDNPDYMVLDIDPLNLPFSFAVEVALETKKILDEIKVKAFCKTSGSRGIHIFIPTGAKYSHDQIKEFAHLINFVVNKKLSKITSLERKPDARNEKVYLDYLQNRKGQTMASVYCVRPKKGAPVSTPLEWKELNEELNPVDFNITNTLQRIKEKGDLWKDIFKSKNFLKMESSTKYLEKIIKNLPK